MSVQNTINNMSAKNTGCPTRTVHMSHIMFGKEKKYIYSTELVTLLKMNSLTRFFEYFEILEKSFSAFL